MAQKASRCNAKTKNGKRCHNNAISGSKYCYIKSHGGINISPFRRLENFVQNNWVVATIAIIATLLGVGIGLLQLKYYYDDKEREKASVLKREQNPVSVSPGEINLNSSNKDNELKAKNYINVFNQTDSWYYQVWVKITMDSSVITAKDISINLPPLENNEKIKSEPSGVSTKALCYVGLDEEKRETFLCFIRELNPKETLTLTLLNDYHENLPELPAHKALVSIVGFNTEPAKILEGNQKGSLSVKFPITFTLDRVLLIVPANAATTIEVKPTINPALNN
ncbi:MAG: hypothetical protein WA584_05660 [Pyrinomonadaceae bacterium]